MQRISGWAEQGHTIVATGGLSSTTRVQGSFALSTLTVYLTGTTNLASIYSDNNQPPTPVANPMTVSANGSFGFYALNGAYDLVFSGTGISAPFTVTAVRVFDPQPLWFDVTAAPYNTAGDGTTDDSTTIAAAITAAKAVKGAIVYFPAYGPLGQHIYRANAVSLNDTTGMIFKGDGAGFYNGESFATQIKYNGAGGTGIFQVSSNTDNVRFEQIQLAGSTQVPSGSPLILPATAGYGVQFLDAGAANNIEWEFDHCVFAYLQRGHSFGSGGPSTTNQMLFTTFSNCSFWSCNRAIYSTATNVQQISFENCIFANGWEYYIYAGGAMDLLLQNVLMITMGPNASSAIVGAITIKWYKGWSEITGGTVYNGSGDITGATAIQLIASTVGASNPGASSVLSGVYHPRRGDASGISITWNGGPLTIDGGAYGGLIQWDSRLPWNRVDGVPDWIPCVDSDILQTVGTPHTNPWIIGPYSNATAADFYIEIVSGTTFKWKKTSGGSFSAAITISDHVTLQEGLIACFSPGVTWTTGDQWKFPCSITGLVNFAGFTPENFIGIRAFQNANVLLVNNVEQVILFNTENAATFQDIYGNFDAATGIFTCMFPGRYRIEAVGQMDTSALANGVPMDFILRVLVNGAETQSETARYSGNAAGVGTIFSGYVSDEVYLAQGDTVKIGAKQVNSSATSLNFIGSGNVNKFYIGYLDHYSSVMR